MKHLKKYKLFESKYQSMTKEIVLDIEDIFLEIQDSVHTSKRYYDNGEENWVRIESFKKLEGNQSAISIYFSGFRSKTGLFDSRDDVKFIKDDVLIDIIDCIKRTSEYFKLNGLENIGYIIGYREVVPNPFGKYSLGKEDYIGSLEYIDELLKKKLHSIDIVMYNHHA